MTVSRRMLFTSGLVAAGVPRVNIVRAEPQRTIRFMPHADLASLDPVWTTADITRNMSTATHDTLYGLDADYQPQLQMAEGHRTEDDGKVWEITLRDGLRFHDGTPVLARDCVATIRRAGKRSPFVAALIGRTDEISAKSDTVIRFRLKRPFPLLPNALAEYQAAIMPERQASIDANTQITEVVGSGPFRFVADERVAGSRVVFAKNEAYVPRRDGVPSFTAGPKRVNVDRVIWTFVPDPSTSAAALANGEYDWWEQPSPDLVTTLQRNRALTVRVTDRTGEIGCLRFNHLHPPFNNPAIRRVILEAVDQRVYIQAMAGGMPDFIRADVGLFVPGTPMASSVGIDGTRGVSDLARIRKDLEAAGYRGEKVVILAASTIPTIWGAAQVTQDLLRRIGMNVDFQALEWGMVVQRRASREPVDKGGWSIFHTLLGGMGNVTPAANNPIRGNGTNAWFGWPEDPQMERLRDAWFEAPDIAAQQKICTDMQAHFWTNPSYVPLGMFDQPTAYRTDLKDVPDGWPQFYNLKRD